MSAAVAWIDLDEAARRSGWNRGHVQRLATKLAPAGKARKEKPPGGGKARWIVAEDADARFARVKFPEQIGTDLSAVPEPKRRVAYERLDVLKRWGEFCRHAFAMRFNRDQATHTFLDRELLDHGRTISRRTLYNWDKSYRTEGLIGLVDGRGKPAAAKQADPFLEQVKAFYLNQNRRSVQLCYEMAREVAGDRGWAVPHYKTAQRFVAAIPKAVVLKHRFGEEAFTNEAATYAERDYSMLASNQVWVGDHHQLDVWVAGADGRPVRPWLTAWQDCRSRKIVGWHLFDGDPNQDTILLAFHNAVMAFGVPDEVYVDNGKDYDAFALQGVTKVQRRRLRVQLDAAHVGGVFGQLGVRVTHCQPYHGQSKPIERFFRTLEERFGKTFDTYCGSSPADRPEGLFERLKAGKAPPLDDYRAAFAAWLDTYHGRAHAGDSMELRSPDQVYAENLGVVRSAPAGLARLLLVPKSRPVKVGQNGVTVGGWGYGRDSAELAAHLGKEVVVRVDPSDVRTASVWTAGGDAFVCLVRANEKLAFRADTPVTREHVRAGLKEQRRLNKIKGAYGENRMRMHLDPTELAIRAAARANAAAGTTTPDPRLPPPSIRPVQTPLAGQLKALEEAHERHQERRAVGAESVSIDKLERLYGEE